MLNSYAIGVDYGTNSCRALVVRLRDGSEIATHVYNYPSGEMGVIVDPREPNLARQSPADYREGLEVTIVAALRKAEECDAEFCRSLVVGIGVDTTGSTPMPVDRHCTPLGLLPEFRDNPNAQAWLWKDHTSHAEAAEITAVAAEMRPEYLAKCGGTYSSEWFWSKILRCKRVDPEVFEAAWSFVELCDWIPALLTGVSDVAEVRRSVCAAGHKAMYSELWGGLPDVEFLGRLDPALAELRGRLYDKAWTADQRAGGLCSEWAGRLGLSEGLAVAVGAFDAHMGAVGAGCSSGALVKILGTSTCDLLVSDNSQPLQDIPGVCGVVDGSVIPGYYGIEAGQSAVGDIFLWFVNRLVPRSGEEDQDALFARLEQEATGLKAGESGLLALDWNNGNRCVLTDVRLSGMLLGQTLYTEPAEIYRALIEATAFGARMIVERVREYGVAVERVVNCGGLAVKSALLMQIYADVMGMPMMVAASNQTCAMGAAMFAAVAAGEFESIEAAQERMCRVRERVYQPEAASVAVYDRLFALYSQLHDGFAMPGTGANMSNVMKELIALREQQRGGGHAGGMACE